MGDFEGVTITNYGNAPSDLSDLSICDGEGSVSFTETLTLEPGCSISVLRSEPDSWIHLWRYLTFDPLRYPIEVALADKVIIYI